MALKPMASAPELSMMSGGLPPTKRGCSSVAIWVDLLHHVGSELHVVDAIAAVENHRVDGRAVGNAERIGRILREGAGRQPGRAEQAAQRQGRRCCRRPAHERAAVDSLIDTHFWSFPFLSVVH